MSEESGGAVGVRSALSEIALSAVRDGFPREQSVEPTICKERAEREALRLCDRESIREVYDARERQNYSTTSNSWDRALEGLLIFLGLGGVLTVSSGILFAIFRPTVVNGWLIAWWLIASLTVLCVPALAFVDWRATKVALANPQPNKAARTRGHFESRLWEGVTRPALKAATVVNFVSARKDVVREVSRSLRISGSADILVRTETYQLVSQQIDRIGGATIGIRGRSGSGKSDVIRALCGERADAIGTHNGESLSAGPVTAIDGSTVRVGVFVSALSSQSQDALIRRLAKKSCEQTLRVIGREHDKNSHDDSRLVGVLVAVAMIVSAVGIRWRSALRLESSALPSILLVAGILLLVILVAGRPTMERTRRIERLIRLRARQLLRPRKRDESYQSAVASGVDSAQARAAIDAAEQLRQRLTFSWSEEVSTEVGANSGRLSARRARTVNRAAMQIGLDEVVERLEDLMRHVSGAGYHVVVGVDELERFAAADREDIWPLLNLLRSLFSIPACSVLITISTTAWSDYERREVRVGSALEPSFDAIVEAAPFDFLEAQDLVIRTLGRLSDAQILFCNVVAGGLPRDLLRNARTLNEIAAAQLREVTFETVARQFIREDGGRKIDAAIERLGGEDGPGVRRAVRRLERLRDGWAPEEWRTGEKVDASQLLEYLPSVSEAGSNTGSGPIRRLARLWRVGEPGRTDARSPANGDDVDEIDEILSDLTTYLTFLLLVEKSFVDGPMDRLAVAIDGLAAAEGGTACWADLQSCEQAMSAWEPFDKLTKARRDLSLGSATAWNRLQEAAKLIDQ